MLDDVKHCQLLAPMFFDTLFNVDKHLDREQNEQVDLTRVKVPHLMLSTTE